MQKKHILRTDSPKRNTSAGHALARILQDWVCVWKSGIRECAHVSALKCAYAGTRSPRLNVSRPTSSSQRSALGAP
eukprot:1650905-Rhodomonas_salina.2